MSESIFDDDKTMNESLSMDSPLSLSGDFSDVSSLDNDDMSLLDVDIDGLTIKVNDIVPDDDPDDDGSTILGTKMCPTRHGCTGATNCNYDYASYPG